VRAFQAAVDTLWAMRQEELDVLLAVAARVQSDPEDAVKQAQALAAKRAPRLDKTETGRKRDGVGILGVYDELFPRANLFNDISGGVSCEVLLQDFRAMMDDPGVNAIILDIDSPGGDMDGTHSLAQAVYEARGVKPVVAYVDGMAASGAYWIASAAKEIVVEPTARLGSVGVVFGLVDTREADAKRGIKYSHVTSEQSPLKRPDFYTEEGRGLLQQMANDACALFVASVARNRGVSEAKVISDFGKGWVVLGEQAVKAGLADRIGSFEGVLAELAETARGSSGLSLAAQQGAGDTGMSSLPEWMDSKLRAMGWKQEGQETSPAQSPHATMDQNAALQARIEALEKQHAADLRRVRLEGEAEAFLSSMRDRITSASRAGFLAGFLAVAATGDEEGLKAYKAGIEALPKHNLTTELVEGGKLDGAQALPPTTESPKAKEATELDEAAEDARTWAKQRNGATAKGGR
jgi:signal peptide peptidase SppA